MFGLYGQPPAELAAWPPDAAQLSPLIAGSTDLTNLAPASLGGLVMQAPPSVAERRHELALALDALAPDAPFIIMAPKDRGGLRLRDELRELGCEFEESAKRHFRICAGLRPLTLGDMSAALIQGGPHYIDSLAAWSQPGLFSWDRLDPGTALLIEQLPALSGQGADLGCGIGLLSRAILRSPKVAQLTLVDLDRRAVALAQRNVEDSRAKFLWADVRAGLALKDLHFIAMNPPFHDSGREDAGLGQVFLRRAQESLRRGGVCWLVANRHLPYEAVLKPLFRRVTMIAERNGYKIIEAMK